ncbi:MAG TPA: quinolinate synthase NadA [Syntrophorhabdaceae bacterium]|jgi:quinolinate synthase|nr:quinolinate synthase NadA [Syntrophorhabdaceae bacterium]MDI9561101.1 quinolinate synthase NadA [Pseudomonadota bacterium]OQC48309.1 MAG: Quinolinate synthase A [Deltaproteobacteria bacterium ADurb.Bin026]MBV6505312.1 Quinolinate synthase A [Syntrophorhabdaceae bacterium]HNQ62946.1 quinolinate synthase NadA [Syntrophorhabdaceae bacterium]
MSEDIINEILELKKQRNAVIVAHNYQVDEVQKIADILGDSFALSRYCASSPHETIVFCGVHFMAESAKILSPQKTVLLPEINAGCPMADMVNAEDIRQLRKIYPNAAVVCYINTTAEVKAECEICCTSSNAVQVIRSLKEKDIIFVPDMNLGNYIARMVPEKNMIIWNGFCITHHRVTSDDVLNARAVHPDALVLVHPECRPDVVDMADFVGSTKQIMDFGAKSEGRKFIIGTEMGVLFRLREDNPDKEFYLLSQGLICPNMKRTKLISVYNALKEMKHRIEIEDSILIRAKSSLDRMMQVV